MISSWKFSRSNLFYSFYDLLKGFSKNFTCVSFAEPPKFGRRFLLLSGGAPLQGSLFSTISALSSAKGAGGSLINVEKILSREIALPRVNYANATSENNWSYCPSCRFLSLISIQCDRSWNWRASKHLNPLTRYSVYNEECYKYWTGQTIPRQSPYERCDNGRLS